jgi:hypothetical protein
VSRKGTIQKFASRKWGKTGRHHYLVGKFPDGTGQMLASVLFHNRRLGWWYACAHGPCGYKRTKQAAMRRVNNEIRKVTAILRRRMAR